MWKKGFAGKWRTLLIKRERRSAVLCWMDLG